MAYKRIEATFPSKEPLTTDAKEVKGISVFELLQRREILGSQVDIGKGASQLGQQLSWMVSPHRHGLARRG